MSSGKKINGFAWHKDKAIPMITSNESQNPSHSQDRPIIKAIYINDKAAITTTDYQCIQKICSETQSGMSIGDDHPEACDLSSTNNYVIEVDMEIEKKGYRKVKEPLRRDCSLCHELQTLNSRFTYP